VLELTVTAWTFSIARPPLADYGRRRLAIDARRARRPQETEPNEDVALVGGQRADATIDEVGVRAAIAACPVLSAVSWPRSTTATG